MYIKVIPFTDVEIKPVRAHLTDAGADVACLRDYHIKPHTTVKIPLGFGLEIPNGYMACLYPRSSLASKGIITHIPPVDAGYNGEIHAIVTNTTDEEFVFRYGDRVGQVVITPVIIADFVYDMGETRGSGAFGSTGR